MEIYGNIDMKRSGEKMKKIITQAGYDVKSIQNYLHLSCPQPVYRWFKGQILPTVDHLFLMSKLLGIHMEDFLVEKGADEQRSCFLTCIIDPVLEQVETGKHSAGSRMIRYHRFISTQAASAE